MTALEVRDTADLTVEYVTSKMLDECQCRQESGQVKEDNGIALQSFAKSNNKENKKQDGAKVKRKENSECYFCNKPGHLKADCRLFKKQQQKTEKQGDKASVCIKGGLEDVSKHQISFAARESAHVAKASLGHWYVDSGASSHMTNQKSFFNSMSATKSAIYMADGTSVDAVRIGEGWLSCELPNKGIQMINLKDVLYVPKLDGNLLSVQQMTHHGFKVVFEGIICAVFKDEVVAEAIQEGNLFRLKNTPLEESARLANVSTCIYRWHRRLGHRDPAAIKRLLSEELATGFNIKGCNDKIIVCEHCAKGKLAQTPFPQSKTRAVQPLNRVLACFFLLF